MAVSETRLYTNFIGAVEENDIPAVEKDIEKLDVNNPKDRHG